MSDVAQAGAGPILVVEDSDDDFDTVVEASRRAQVRNRRGHAPSADAARERLATPRLGPFAFMLLDCSLPTEDGPSFLQALRREPAHALMPVVVFTAGVNPRERNAFHADGANACDAKQVRFEAGLATVQGILEFWLRQVVLPHPRALQPLGSTRP